MRTGFILKNSVKILLIGLLPLNVFPRLSAPQSSKVKLSFSMLTAAHAAVGVPMASRLVITNRGAAIQIGAYVELVDPSGESFTLRSTEYTLEHNQVEVASVAFETSSFTSATGTFTLRDFITDIPSGDILDELDVALTVVPVPDNFVYASIGGQGPASARLGYTTDYQTVVANLGTASMSLKTNITLVLVDGTEMPLIKGEPQTFN